jgi:hypothetical protein
MFNCIYEILLILAMMGMVMLVTSVGISLLAMYLDKYLDIT